MELQSIKPQELRIGNIVRLKSKNKDYVIDSGYEIDTGTDSDDFEPTELTEDWLLKFGYDRNKNEYCISGHDRFNVFQSVKGPYIFCDDEKSIRYVKYVHELQNIFFALTGEELKIKES